MWLLGARILSLTVDLYRLSTEGRGPWIPSRRNQNSLVFERKIERVPGVSIRFVCQKTQRNKGMENPHLQSPVVSQYLK